MKQILIAFVAATVLLALEDALARQCRNLLWSGILPLAAVFGIYLYLSKGGQKYSALVWVLLAIAIVGSVLGIFA